MSTPKLVFEHKGPVSVTQSCQLHGVLTHFARDVTVHRTGPDGEPDVRLLVTITECRFRDRFNFCIAADGQRYCEILARDGNRLFDSRDLIPCEPAPVPKKVVPLDSYGKRPHPRHFRELRNR
jgi:hypothetical protein